MGQVCRTMDMMRRGPRKKRGINTLRCLVTALTIKDMRSAREEANPVEATITQDTMILKNMALENMALDNAALARTVLANIVLSGKRHEQGCPWSRPS